MPGGQDDDDALLEKLSYWCETAVVAGKSDEYFGVRSDRQNVIRRVRFCAGSPLIVRKFRWQKARFPGGHRDGQIGNGWLMVPGLGEHSPSGTK